MKTWKLTAACLAAVSCIGSSAWSRPVDLSAPSGEVGAANSKGYLEIWREIENAGIDFGKGSYLPLRYKFSSEDNTGGILGPGFYMPMFEAKNVLIREGTMRAYLPCGKGLYFWKDPVDPTKFQTVDKEWTGALSANNDFTVWRNDGWTILYHQGRLTTITTDEHHVFTWDYDGNTHMATGISEDGQSLVSVEPNQQGLVGALVFNGKRYEMGYSERPLIEMVLGQPAVKELAIALSSFKHPDGKAETFQFVLTPERVPMLTFTDTDQKQTVYTWNAANDHIASEQGPGGDWTYKIGDITQDFGSPPITRTSPDGKMEGMAIDTKMGTYTSQAADGVTTITHVFETPGPLYHKVQKIEEITGKTTTLVYRASYDETGKLIREVDETGYITKFNYDDQGKIQSKVVSLSQNPEVLASFKKKEKELMDIITKATTLDDKQYAIRSLAQFYLFEMKDNPKALSFLSQLDHTHSYALRVQMIDADQSLNPLQKADKYQSLLEIYPEYKDDLESLINMRKEEAKNENS
jgi:YD repeat-containing protein